MRRKTLIVLAITSMVAALVTLFSYLYIYEVLHNQITTTRETAFHLTSQLSYLADRAVPDLSSTKVNTSSPESMRQAIAYYLSTDNDLNVSLESVAGEWPYVYDTSVVDVYGKAILHTNPDLIGKQIADRPDFQLLANARFRRQLRMIYNPPTVYEVRMPLELNGAPFGSIRLGISTVFLKNQLTPLLYRAVIFSSISIFLSLLLAAGVSNLALGPLKRISSSLDSVSAGHAETLSDQERSRDEYAPVKSKIAHLGRQMRHDKEIFSALKDNVDQIMANLQDGLMLFTRESRVVLVSASVERFLGRPRHELLGRTAKEIFSRDSALGALILGAFPLRQAIPPRELESFDGKRVQVSLDFISERGSSFGALLTLSDVESVSDVRRVVSSSHSTRNVAHEVKNPINAIVLHLQLLQNKLREIDPDTRRHMDVIDGEIHRLDRVVQILVDFTRPRDLRMEEIDLRRVLEDVITLAGPDAGQHKVSITRDLAPDPLTVRVDTDSMKQAILNVVLNGIQAMPEGGTLTISSRREEDTIITEVQDLGGGIPREIQDKIFELYFTTKKSGSGIGLAWTYQILQWHYGSVDFESVEGRGTTFRLRLPFAEPRPGVNAGDGQTADQTLGSTIA